MYLISIQGRFRVNGVIYISNSRGLVSPYLISSYPQPQHYVLCNQNRNVINSS